MSGPAEVWLGTSGYVYRHWRKGVFYPPGLPAREELAYFAQRFKTVELNNPFYRLPTAEMFQRWREVTPDRFHFAVKASRYITHIKRLRDVSDELALFLERADHLGPKLGPDPVSAATEPADRLGIACVTFSSCCLASGGGSWSSGIRAGIPRKCISSCRSIPWRCAFR